MSRQAKHYAQKGINTLVSCDQFKALQQGNESMYSNTSGYVHMGLRLDWGKGITGQ